MEKDKLIIYREEYLFFEGMMENVFNLNDSFYYEKHYDVLQDKFIEVDGSIDLSIVIDDRNKCIKNVINFVEDDTNSLEDKEIIIAVYVIFYIKSGMASRFYDEECTDQYGGLDDFFSSLDVKHRYLRDVYDAVKYQDNLIWQKIIKENENSIISRIYLFIYEYMKYSKHFSEILDMLPYDTHKLIQGLEKYEYLFKIYDEIPDEWKEYLFEDEINQATNVYDYNFSVRPQIYNGTYREILMIETFGVLNYILRDLGMNVEEIVEDEDEDKTYNLVSKVEEVFPNISSHDGYKQFLIDVCNYLLLFSDYDYSYSESEFDLCLIDDFNSFKSELKNYNWNWNKVNRSKINIYLKSPIILPIQREMFILHKEEYRKRKELEEKSRKNQEMLDYYAHSWKHISYPQIIKEVADELSNTNLSIANRLMKAYNSELTLQREIELLQYISSDDECKVKNEFKGSMARMGSNSDRVMDLQTVVSDSLDLVVFKLLMTESDDSMAIIKCRDKWDRITSLHNLRNNYTDSFINCKNEYVDIIEWTNKNIIKLDLRISNNCKQIRFYKDKFAVNQFKSILIEIFTNAFLHGEGFIKMKIEDRLDVIVIESENKNSDEYRSWGTGLSTLNTLLNYLNVECDLDYSLSTEFIDNDIFKLIVVIDKKILMRKGR